MDLNKTRKIQNNIFIHDIMSEDGCEQNFLYFLGNHPTLFQEFVEPGFLTIAEMNYICEHFFDYKVDARTFENEFKREMREHLPRYNIMKAEELKDEIFQNIDEDYIRAIVSERATSLAQNGNKTTTGTNSSSTDVKEANRQEPMESTGNNFDATVNWNRGASAIGENKTTGSSTINQSDINALTSNGTDNGNSHEYFTKHGDPLDHVNRIWDYLVKPKAINWLTAQLSSAFILCY